MEVYSIGMESVLLTRCDSRGKHVLELAVLLLRQRISQVPNKLRSRRVSIYLTLQFGKVSQKTGFRTGRYEDREL